jgi:hypothetical protein
LTLLEYFREVIIDAKLNNGQGLDENLYDFFKHRNLYGPIITPKENYKKANSRITQKQYQLTILRPL